ncbi:MAG: VacJ family lipoprotein [Alphaproteobacteria bacterium]|nr:VacJ family lipoprotein [Alphaproteobacteria bacterium]
MRAVIRRVPLIAVALVAGWFAGCAARPPAGDQEALQEYRQTNDPWEPTNRFFYRINRGFDAVILKPAAEGYRFIVPAPMRNGIHNVLANLTSPVLFSNDVLQGKPRRAGDTFMRFLINSTAGIGGIFDVAKNVGYPAHDTDFGVTLALWGVPSGPFLFLPVLGPTDPRDVAGFGVGIIMDPFTWVGQGATVTALGWTRYGMSAIDARERHLDEVDQITKTALDPYATFRSLYRQHRQGEIEKTREDNRATVPAWFPQPAPEAAPPARPGPEPGK